MLRRIFSYMGKYKKYAALAIACVAAESMFELIVPLIMADLIDVGVANQDRHYIYMKGFQMGDLCCAGPASGNRKLQVFSTCRAGAWSPTAQSRVRKASGFFLC